MHFRRARIAQQTDPIDNTMRSSWDRFFRENGFMATTERLNEVTADARKERNVLLATGAAVAFGAIASGPGLLSMGLSLGAGVLLCMGNDSRRLLGKFNQLGRELQAQQDLLAANTCPYKLETVDTAPAQPSPAPQALTR